MEEQSSGGAKRQMEERVFVYGTLKRGYSMGNWLNDNAEFLYEGAVLGHLYNLGGFPGYKRSVEDREPMEVQGEILKVTSKEVMDRLDQYEGVDVGMYSKRKVKAYVPSLSEDEECVAMPVTIYEYNSSVPSHMYIDSGMWNAARRNKHFIFI